MRYFSSIQRRKIIFGSIVSLNSLLRRWAALFQKPPDAIQQFGTRVEIRGREPVDCLPSVKKTGSSTVQDNCDCSRNLESHGTRRFSTPALVHQ
jgi:hypothetical protein